MPTPLRKSEIATSKVYETMKEVREYLTKERKISEKIIDQMFAEGKNLRRCGKAQRDYLLVAIRKEQFVMQA